MYVKTLELAPMQESAFKLFRHWGLVKFLNSFGLSKMLAKQSSKLYADSAVFGAIVVPNNSKVDFVIAGRIMQRVWLYAVKLGLSMQPVTALVFLEQRILSGQIQELSPNHIKLIQIACKQIKNLFTITEGIIAMLFRIGDGEEPSARSSRMEPEIF
jgi:hypothetical protein